MSEFEKELESILEKNSEYYQGITTGNVLGISKHFKYWQPPKQLVEVPQLVARHIETEKDNDRDRVGTLVYGHYKAIDGYEEYSELDEWIANNFDTFLEAIVNGYTVEKEQMFYLREKNTWYYLTKSKKDSLKLVSNPYFDEDNKFTQSEIDELNIGSYEQIAVKVDEAEDD